MEERVDGEIRRVTRSARRAFWNVLQNAGWSALAQVGDVVGLVTAMMPVGDEGDGEQPEARRNRRTEQDGRDDGDDDGEGGDNVHGYGSVEEDDGNDVSEETGPSESEPDDNRDIYEETELSDREPGDKMQEIQSPGHNNPSAPALLQNNDTSSSSQHLVPDCDPKLEPVSSFASLSSLRSEFGFYTDDENFLSDNDSADCAGDKNSQTLAKSYLRDLTLMLRNGLYVYASHGEDGDNDNAVCDGSNKNTDRPFHVSLFSYHPALSATATTVDPDDEEMTQPLYDCFVFGPKPSPTQIADDSHSKQIAKDSVILPVDDVVKVRKAGTHAIEFITSSSSSTPKSQLQPTLSKLLASGTLERAQSTSSNVSEESFVTLMKSWSDVGNKAQQPVMEREDEDLLFAEMVLLDGEDRDTLFVGLRTLLKTLGRRGAFDNHAREEMKNDTKIEEEVKIMGSDVDTEELACRMKKEDNVKETESEEGKDDLESKEDESPEITLDGDAVMSSDGVVEECTCETEKEDDIKKKDLEEDNDDLEFKEDVSPSKALDEDIVVSTIKKGELSQGDKEDIEHDQSKALGNDTLYHERLVVDEPAIMEEDSKSRHFTSKSNEKDKTWEHGIMADDQVLGEEA